MSIFAPLVTGFGLAHPNHADRRLGEDGAGHHLVVESRRLVVEHGVGEGGALADGDRRQVDAVGDVADGPDVVGVGLGIVVDAPPRPCRSARLPAVSRPRPLVCGARPVANITTSLSRSAAPSKVVDESRPPSSPATCAWHPRMTLMPLPLHLAGQVRAHVIVEATQDVGAAHDERGLDAQPVEDAGELHGDIAAADDDHPPGQALQVEGFVRGDRQLDPGQLRHDRPAAGGDEDLVGAEGLVLVGQLDGVGVDQFGPGVGQIGAGVLQVGDIDAGQPGDLDVAALDESRSSRTSACRPSSRSPPPP